MRAWARVFRVVRAVCLDSCGHLFMSVCLSVALLARALLSFPFSHVPKKHMWPAEGLTPSGEEIKEWVGLAFLCWLPLFLVPTPVPSSPPPTSAIKAEVYKLLPAKKL